ncbi:MAG: (2E,6E)-farnesyl diphosphate synthase [Hahellaceae bacterium]|nr:(2E,6E)-farnesyl diphosphate synthase [Hahellaceae bacterium]MCP5210819.1 (2E,6E)-farnesyl diphosphate synthase [Hahellaceae bacterium]
MTDFPSFLASCAKDTEHALDLLLTRADIAHERLLQAMRYSTLNGGKRVRPALLIATAEAFGADRQSTLRPACAMEMIHVYSLIHDDLPAMDNDDLRRGKPTCHRAFDEATAILAGDALQALAFKVIAESKNFSAEHRLQMVSVLAAASGAEGMIAGQSIDLASVGQPLSIAQLESMHLYKTGALIEASVVLGAICAGKDNPETISALRSFARCIGLAFQVKDDILDVEADTATLGKQQGADAALNKPTYVSLLGLDGAKHKCRQLLELAKSELDLLVDADTSVLKALSDYIVSRGN